MKINVTVLILAALMAGLAGCDESLQLEWNDTLGTRNAAWTGMDRDRESRNPYPNQRLPQYYPPPNR